MKNQLSQCSKCTPCSGRFCECGCHLPIPEKDKPCKGCKDGKRKGCYTCGAEKGTWEDRWDDHWQDNAPDYVKIKDFLHQEINKAYQEGSAKKGEHGRKMYEQGYKESKTQIIQEIIKISEGMKNTTEMKEIEGIKYTTGFKKALSDLKESLQELNKKQ